MIRRLSPTFSVIFARVPNFEITFGRFPVVLCSARSTSRTKIAWKFWICCLFLPGTSHFFWNSSFSETISAFDKKILSKITINYLLFHKMHCYTGDLVNSILPNLDTDTKISKNLCTKTGDYCHYFLIHTKKVCT